MKIQLNEVIQSYQTVCNEENKRLEKLKAKIFRVGSLRLLVVLLCAFSIYYFWGNTAVVVISIILSIILFLFLLKYHNKLFNEKRYRELLISNAENELKGINYDFSAFDGATDKIDSTHSYSLDLDLFGDKSFFQTINRTVTTQGRDNLANLVLMTSDNRSDILARQSIIQELTSKPQLLNHIRAVGQTSETEHLDVRTFSSKFEVSKSLNNSIWKYTPILPATLIIIYLLITSTTSIPTSIFGIMYTLLLVLSLVPLKWIRPKMALFEKKINSLQTYSDIFKIIEDEKFTNEYLIGLQSKVKSEGSASLAIHKLQSLSHNLDQSQNALGLLVLNPFAFWNVIYTIKIEKWIIKYKGNVDTWFDVIGQFDSYISLAIYAYNHPSYTYPKITDSMVFEATELGHPMINRDLCVTNDVNISQHPYFLVVTGANMAGKSTYLRTVGLNMTLANIGAPVFAQQMKYFPFHLVTNLRTSDSLADNESYFFAELKRLKMIIDRLQAGEHLFIILDEILKGTNSEDKQKGSIALMRQLIANKGCGIIATHDLILGDLEKEYPSEVKNYRFEADISNEVLTFSYKIREGIAQNMNACFLMKKMGITGL